MLAALSLGAPLRGAASTALDHGRDDATTTPASHDPLLGAPVRSSPCSPMAATPAKKSSSRARHLTPSFQLQVMRPAFLELSMLRRDSHKQPEHRMLERRAEGEEKAPDAGGDEKASPEAPPPISYGSGTRQLAASMGLPPYGMDCCPCLANEEDWRVYPVTPALLQTAEEQFASFLQMTTTVRKAPPPGPVGPGVWAGMVDPSSTANRMAYSVMGTPPYGMDCCPCLSNEEDYRVYPPQ